MVRTIEGSDRIGLGTNRYLGHYVNMMHCNIDKECDTSIDGNAAFDVWLSESLSAAYDVAICDPVPEEILAIVVAAFEPHTA